MLTGAGCEVDPKTEVSLYFASREAIEEGVPKETGYTIPVSREIDDPQDLELLLKTTLEKLIEGPTSQEKEEYRASSVVHEFLTVREVKIDDKTAIVNVCEEMFGDEWAGGALRGVVFKQSFLYTALQFPEVEKLLVQVEGEVWDDGHFRWEEPLLIEEDDELIGETIRFENEVDSFGGEKIQVFDAEDQLIYEYSFQEFLAWAEDNWEDVFDEVPAFHEERPIYPEDLYPYFGKTAVLSPDGTSFSFVVSDYFAATDASFVGVVCMHFDQVSLVDEKNMGETAELVWSHDGAYMAYVLHTAVAQRNHLTVDHVESMTKEFTLGEEDLIKELDQENVGPFLPKFSQLNWHEEEMRIEFMSNAPEEIEAEYILWSMDSKGEDLITEDVVNGSE